ncbi:MAG: hypothetical protein MK110_15725 [Fuerstiella sp.]|nr:hypothetical protein [Fuerstiella sp.]
MMIGTAAVLQRLFPRDLRRDGCRTDRKRERHACSLNTYPPGGTVALRSYHGWLFGREAAFLSSIQLWYGMTVAKFKLPRPVFRDYDGCYGQACVMVRVRH